MVERTKEGRVLKTIEFDGYQLLSDEKLGRVMDFLDGISESLWGTNAKRSEEDARLFSLCSSIDKKVAVLALYDRLGGGVKTADGRKIASGTFYDFEKREPRKEVKLGEEQFDDKYVLVHKEKKVVREKGIDLKNRIKQMEEIEKKPKRVKDDE